MKVFIDDCDAIIDEALFGPRKKDEIVSHSSIIQSCGVIEGVDVGTEEVGPESKRPNGHFLERDCEEGDTDDDYKPVDDGEDE